MRYPNIMPARFLERPNRFVALVEAEGEVQRAHVKNTGRCRELLMPGAKVYLVRSANPARATKWDLVAVEKRLPDGASRLVNMDSMAPNQAAGEWLNAGGLGKIENLRAEVKVGESRFDFCGESEGKRLAVEVKGCTLEENGVARFPDAPTLRGLKHVRELTILAKRGWRCAVLILIQMKGVCRFEPNWKTQPEFGEALIEARAAGVQIIALDCIVRPGEVIADKQLPVQLSRPED